MLTKKQKCLSRVSKIPRRLKLGIHTYTHPRHPLPLPFESARLPGTDPTDPPRRINRRPLAFIIMIIFVILSLDLLPSLCYYIYVQ